MTARVAFVLRDIGGGKRVRRKRGKKGGNKILTCASLKTVLLSVFKMSQK